MKASRLRSGSRVVALVTCAVALVLCGEGRLRAHGGHAGIEPVLRQLPVGPERWQVGVGVVPPDPVAGETLHIEIKADQLGADGRPGAASTADNVRLRVDGTPIGLQGTPARGVFAAEYRIDTPGDHRIAVEVRGQSASRGTTDFPLLVRPGPVPRIRNIILGIVAVFVVAVGVFIGSNRSVRVMLASPEHRRVAIGGLVALIAVVVLLVGPVTTVVARGFLPQREEQEVDWIPEGEPPESLPQGKAAPVAPAPPPATPAGGTVVLGDVLGRVMAAPDRLAEVVVPMTARIAPGSMSVTVGRHVEKGQTLTVLQPTYIVHDALHLINLRWPILQSTVEAKRLMLETEATAERLKLALPEKAVSVREVQIAETNAAAARQEYEKWFRTLTMHDAQINDKQKPIQITSPINGEVAAARFAQGQIVYEGDALYTVVDLSTVWVEARVPEEQAGRFRRRTAEFTAATFPGQTFTGRLERVAPTVDPVTRTLSHFYVVPNPRKLLRIGMVLDLQRGAPDAVS